MLIRTLLFLGLLGASADERGFRLLAELYDRGHVEAKVVPVTHDDGTTTFDVHEGPVYHLAAVEVRGDTLGLFPSIGKSGERFSRARIARALRAGEEAYRARGYGGVDVEIRSDADQEHHLIRLTIEVVPGQRTGR